MNNPASTIILTGARTPPARRAYGVPEGPPRNRAPDNAFGRARANARIALSTNPVDTGVHILYIRALSTAADCETSAMPKDAPQESPGASMGCAARPAERPRGLPPEACAMT
ncbi:MAG: hypothetical protein AMXMBFR42_10320 [Burkholderiales bacterium]